MWAKLTVFCFGCICLTYGQDKGKRKTVHTYSNQKNTTSYNYV